MLTNGESVGVGTAARQVWSAERGFSLIELMITLSILAILLAVAVPGFSSFIKTQRVRAASSDVFASLIIARSEAMKRNANVSLVRTSSAWADGWTVQIASSSTVLHTQDSISGVTVDGPAAATITYTYTGRPLAASVNASFTVSPAATDASVAARCISINLSGMPINKVDADGNYANGC